MKQFHHQFPVSQFHCDVAYVVGDTSNWAYNDHRNLNIAIKICGYYSQYWYENIRK